MNASIALAWQDVRTSPRIPVSDAAVSDSVRLTDEIANAPSTLIDLSKVAEPREISPELGESGPAIRLQMPALKPGQVRIKALPRQIDDASRQLIFQPLRDQDTVTSAGEPPVLFRGAAEMLSAEAGELTLRALALADRALRYNPRRQVFEGSLGVGVVEIEPSGKSLTLSAPVAFEVLGIVAEPKRVNVDKTAPPFETIAIEVKNPGERVDVRVWSVLDPGGEVILPMPVQKPKLSVTITPKAIQGWGLEKARVLVQATNIGGGRVGLQVASTVGELDSNTLHFDSDATGIAVLRSASTGTATVTVSGSPFEPVSENVEFVLPLRYMLAALIGGLAGGFLRLARKRAGIKSVVRSLLVGVIAGVIVFGLFVLGVNVTGFGLPAQAGEVLVFVVTALGAFGGARLLVPGPRPQSGQDSGA